MAHCLPTLPLEGEKLEAQIESGLPGDTLWQWQYGYLFSLSHCCLLSYILFDLTS